LLNVERQRQISQFIEEKKLATVAELSTCFGVSEATIRRDLEKLESAGIIQRVHGGAISSNGRQARPEPIIIQRAVEHAAEKQMIGRVAASLVREGETVFLGSGTTTLEVARHLKGKKDLTVITNALNIASELAGEQDITLIVVGGLLRHSELSMIGHIAEQTLQELHADKVIMGMRALSLSEGLTNEYLPETMTDRAIISFAPEVILVIDHSKFDKVSTALVAPVTRVSKIVTDDQAPPEIVTKLRDLGIEVILAGEDTEP
jgi:DeoR/GlpR family transcriptional regulator of sugar metabolism